MNQPETTKKPLIYLRDLGFWNLYFLIKYYLFYKGTINFHFLENFAFILFLVAPFQEKSLQIFRKYIAIPVGISVLYLDTYLPGIDTLIMQIDRLLGFNAEYLFELTTRLIDFKVIASAVIVFGIFQLLKYTVRFTSITIVGYLYFALMPEEVELSPPVAVLNNTQTQSTTFANIDTRSSNLDQSSEQSYLNSFFQTESQRLVPFDNTELKAPFDVLIMNICSLSWKELEYTGLANHVLFEKFDLLFRNFNVATSYSGPASIRLLRASCGQSKHTNLYDQASEQCYLYENFAKLGFDHELVINHDGKYNNYLRNLSQYAGWNVEAQELSQTPVIQRAFDSSPIYSDRALFDDWLARHNETKPRATFSQSISLHDGNKLLGDQASLSSLENFHPRLLSLLNDLNYFFEKIEQSGRKVMLIMIPEHGAGIEGDKLQLPGMREFPTPALTHVPVGVKFFGAKGISSETININDKTSYLAISRLIQQSIDHDIFGEPTSTMPQIIQTLPSTEFVSENDDSKMILFNGRYRLQVGKDWVDY